MSDRNLSKRGYQVSLTVWIILCSKGYSVPLLIPVISAPFDEFDPRAFHDNDDTDKPDDNVYN